MIRTSVHSDTGVDSTSPVVAVSEQGNDSRDWGRYTQQAGLAGCVLALGVYFTVKNGNFASHGNLIELLRSATLYFIVACPATLVLVGGGLDFSVGAVYA